MWGELISCSSLSSLISICEALVQKILAFEEGLAVACCRPNFQSKANIVGIFWKRQEKTFSIPMRLIMLV